MYKYIDDCKTGIKRIGGGRVAKNRVREENYVQRIDRDKE